MQSPAATLQRRRQWLETLTTRLVRADAALRRQYAQRLAGAARTLHAVSPLATVARGYAVVRDADGAPVTDAARLAVGDGIGIELRDGTVSAEVTAVTANDD